MSHTPSDDLRETAIDKFWETFPPFWQQVRMHIRQVAAERFSLSVEQFHILRHLRRGLDSNSELSAALSISRPAASQAIDTLVEKGLVQRTPDTRDRRYVRLELTPAGEALIEEVFRENKRWMLERWAALQPGELNSLIQAFEILRKG
ncbi:MAG: MarR family transcriptional regulator [Anaerolineales bacterium]|jgi:DNA-binding MarR family transcriptional regulator|nr:MarR family transcriptional regulator [Anaerolineales bacterium]